MLSISEIILTEEIVTRKQVGQGIGGYLGQAIGGIGGVVLGGLLGHAIGDGTFEDGPKSGTTVNDVVGSSVPDGMINSRFMATNAGMALGALGGGMLGSMMGAKKGWEMGGNMISDPDKPADFNKRSHRVALLSRVHSNPAIVATNVITSPLNVPGRVGYMAGNISNAMNGGIAQKMGYKTPGRVATAILGPISGLFKPGQVAKNK